MNYLNVFYVCDENLIQQCDRLPAVIGRASLVHSLIAAYNLLEHVKVVSSTPATYQALKEFHSELYLDHLQTFTDIDEDYTSSALDEEYGIGYDCPPVSNMYELVSTIAGGSLTAAKCLVHETADVAINWSGGWHHAQRFGADGFCYVNDIVLAIQTLQKKYSKVLYIDLDLHHGNGVQDAFNLSNSVFTLSFHKFEPGFYPGSGDLEDIGTLTGKGYSCNMPLKAAYSDETLGYVFEKIFEQVNTLFTPDAIVVQCGADALAHDPHGGGGLSIQGYCACLRKILDKRKPILLLGGGGYKHPNAARLWTSLTALVTGVELDEYIPEHENWPCYGPDYMLAVESTLARDANKKSYLDDCLATIMSNQDKYLRKKENAYEPEVKQKTVEQNTKKDCDFMNTNTVYKTEESKENKLLHYNEATNTTSTMSNVDVYEFIDD